MPTIERFASFRIAMYYGDHNPPHVHLEARDWRAKVAISDGALLKGRVPPGTLRTARAWIRNNRTQLLEKWTELNERDER